MSSTCFVNRSSVINNFILHDCTTPEENVKEQKICRDASVQEMKKDFCNHQHCIIPIFTCKLSSEVKVAPGKHKRRTKVTKVIVRDSILLKNVRQVKNHMDRLFFIPRHQSLRFQFSHGLKKVTSTKIIARFFSMLLCLHSIKLSS